MPKRARRARNGNGAHESGSKRARNGHGAHEMARPPDREAPLPRRRGLKTRRAEAEECQGRLTGKRQRAGTSSTLSSPPLAKESRERSLPNCGSERQCRRLRCDLDLRLRPPSSRRSTRCQRAFSEGFGRGVEDRRQAGPVGDPLGADSGRNAFANNGIDRLQPGRGGRDRFPTRRQTPESGPDREGDSGAGFKATQSDFQGNPPLKDWGAGR